jgi:hypothetical protein
MRCASLEEGEEKKKGVADRLSQRAFDDTVLIKKKYKAKPVTPAEINDCGMTLNPQQMLAVTASALLSHALSVPPSPVVVLFAWGKGVVLVESSWYSLAVAAGSKKIEFGRVSIGAAVPKCLAITNDLKQSILVTIDTCDWDELSRTTPMAQVIPPQSTAGFDITFCSDRVHPFAQTIAYTINGIHRNNVSITGEVHRV